MQACTALVRGLLSGLTIDVHVAGNTPQQVKFDVERDRLTGPESYASTLDVL